MPEGTLGIVGLGRMGGNMAENLLEAGFGVYGFDVSEEAEAEFREAGGTVCENAAGVATRAPVIITSLPNPPIVKESYLGDDGLLAHADPGTVFLEMSTIDPETTLSIADAAADRDVEVVGAPVSGGPEDCREGTLTVMAGGGEEVVRSDRVQSVLEILGREVYHTGGVDSGHTLKLVNNVMSMGNLLLAMEAVSFGSARGVDGEVLMEVLGNSGGASNQFEKRIPRVLNRNFEPGFTVDFGKKDVGLALDTAEEMDRPMFVANLVHTLFTEASAAGYGEEDVGAVVKLFEEHGDAVVEAEESVDETFEGY